MIPISRHEREWLLRNLAQGLSTYIGAAEPPVAVEELLNHPPEHLQRDFGVVDMYSTLWDATFARPLGRRGSVFVQIDLPPDQRRFALAREMLSALITSKHGRSMGLDSLLLNHLGESAQYFARMLLVPELLLAAYCAQGGDEKGLADRFQIPPAVALRRWEDTPVSLN